MKKINLISISLLVILLVSSTSMGQVKISKEVLKDKIKGGWAGQTIGVTFGGPIEFKHNSTFVHDYKPIEWYDGLLKWWYVNQPGLYDDIYMDLTFVQVYEEKGLDAEASDFAKAFAYADYMLWHANQAARYNIQNGVMPPESGNWVNNPHADDIDYQIEADFSGLMNPGMPASVAEVGDKIGHIMNYGDGWYGGIYMGTMYSLAFVSDDIEYIVEEALKSIPEESKFYQTINDVIKWHKENPDDWKQTWFKVQTTWGEDVGCPDGVFTPFNIDAKINAAWVVLGLLYGDGDFGKSLSISTRAGDDADCNPSTVGGILGTIMGYDKIPDYWKQGLAEVEPMDFKYTTISLNDVYEMSFKHACAMIERNGGTVNENDVEIKVQDVKPVKLEVGFKGHYPIERRKLDATVDNEYEFTFTGIGFVVNGRAQKAKDIEEEYTFETEVYVDGQLIQSPKLPTVYTSRSDNPCWKYNLPQGEHTVKIKVLNPTDKAQLKLNDVVIYSNKQVVPKY